MEIDINTLREVEQSELRVDDKIIALPRVPDDAECVMRTSDPDGDVETEERFYDPEHYRFFLVHRETPELPTKPGTFIRVFSNAGSGSWLVQEGDLFVSGGGVVFTREEFLDFIAERPDRSFEVVA